MKKFLVLIPILLILILNKTYAIFYSRTNGNTDIALATWNIDLNDNTLTSVYNNEVLINNIIWENIHANQNTVAPGSRGHFNIIINPNDTDVAFRFDVSYIDKSIDISKTLTVTNMTLDGVNLNKTANDTYTGVFNLNDSSKTLTVYLEWINDEENNDNDSNIGLGSEMEETVFNFKATQYYGDVIEVENE